VTKQQSWRANRITGAGFDEQALLDLWQLLGRNNSPCIQALCATEDRGNSLQSRVSTSMTARTPVA
jgi:hypothetical protein